MQYAFLLVINLYVDQPFLNNNYVIHKLKYIQFPVSVHVIRLFVCCHVFEHPHTHISSLCNTLFLQTHSKTTDVWSWAHLLVQQKSWCMWWCPLINVCSATCFHSSLKISIIPSYRQNPVILAPQSYLSEYNYFTSETVSYQLAMVMYHLKNMPKLSEYYWAFAFMSFL